MGGLAGAWLVGISIAGWRQVKSSQHLPVPAALLAVTGLFTLLALGADISVRARPAITLAAWGLDVAGLLNVLPAGLFSEISQTEAVQNRAEAGTSQSGGSANVIPASGFNNSAPITTL